MMEDREYHWRIAMDIYSIMAPEGTKDETLALLASVEGLIDYDHDVLTVAAKLPRTGREAILRNLHSLVDLTFGDAPRKPQLRLVSSMDHPAPGVTGACRIWRAKCWRCWPHRLSS